MQMLRVLLTCAVAVLYHSDSVQCTLYNTVGASAVNADDVRVVVGFRSCSGADDVNADAASGADVCCYCCFFRG